MSGFHGIFASCALVVLLPFFPSSTVQADDEGITQIICTLDKVTVDVSPEHPLHAKLLAECERVLTEADGALDLLIPDEQVARWRKNGCAEVVYGRPRRFSLPPPVNHTYEMTGLLIPLEEYETGDLAGTLVIGSFAPQKMDVFLNETYPLSDIKELVELAVRANKAPVAETAVEEKTAGFIEAQQYAEAVEVYEDAIVATTDPAAKSRYCYNLSKVCELLRDYGGQVDALQRAAALTPDSAVRCDYLEELAKVYIANKEQERARPILEEVVAQSKKDWQKRSAMANLLRLEPDKAKLLARAGALEARLKAEPENEQVLDELALIYGAVMRDYAKAIPIYETLTRLRPTDPAASASLQSAYEQVGQFGAALGVFERVVQKDPDAVSKLIQHASRLAERPEHAATILPWAIKYSESHAQSGPAQAFLGRLAFRLKEYDLALAALAKAENLAETQAQSDSAILEQVAVDEKRGDVEAMEKNLRRLVKATESSETRATGLVMLVRLLQQQNRLQEMVTW